MRVSTRSWLFGLRYTPVRPQTGLEAEMEPEAEAAGHHRVVVGRVGRYPAFAGLALDGRACWVGDDELRSVSYFSTHVYFC